MNAHVLLKVFFHSVAHFHFNVMCVEHCALLLMLRKFLESAAQQPPVCGGISGQIFCRSVLSRLLCSLQRSLVFVYEVGMARWDPGVYSHRDMPQIQGNQWEDAQVHVDLDQTAQVTCKACTCGVKIRVKLEELRH